MVDVNSTAQQQHEDEVARLERRVADLRAALQPFVNCNFTYFSGKVLGSDAKLTREDVQRARDALAGTGGVLGTSNEQQKQENA